MYQVPAGIRRRRMCNLRFVLATAMPVVHAAVVNCAVGRLAESVCEPEQGWVTRGAESFYRSLYGVLSRHRFREIGRAHV